MSDAPVVFKRKAKTNQRARVSTPDADTTLASEDGEGPTESPSVLAAKLKKKTEPAVLKERKSKDSNETEPSAPSTPKSMKPIAQAKVVKPKEDDLNGPEAVILLKEEKAHIFHDFLRFVYPQCAYSLLPLLLIF